MTKDTYKLSDVVGRCNKVGDPGLTGQGGVSTWVVHPSVEHGVGVLVLRVARLLLAHCAADVQLFAMKIQRVRVLQSIIHRILTIIRDKTVSKVVSKKSFVRSRHGKSKPRS